jgi:hypothetical protein
MCCEDLVCARCSGPVAEGRCPTCRAARAELHHHTGFSLTPQLVALILLVLTAIALLAAHQVQ